MDCLETQHDRCEEDDSIEFLIRDHTKVGLFLFFYKHERLF